MTIQQAGNSRGAPRLVYHLAEPQEWEAAQDGDTYIPEDFCEDGFIHFSEKDQVASGSARFFPGRDDLILLTIDESKLTAELRREPANPDKPGQGPLYPHLYGALNIPAVIASRVYTSGQEP